LRVSKWW